MQDKSVKVTFLLSPTDIDTTPKDMASPTYRLFSASVRRLLLVFIVPPSTRRRVTWPELVS